MSIKTKRHPLQVQKVVLRLHPCQKIEKVAIKHTEDRVDNAKSHQKARNRANKDFK
jgi:hypothetical protein